MSTSTERDGITEWGIALLHGTHKQRDEHNAREALREAGGSGQVVTRTRYADGTATDWARPSRPGDNVIDGGDTPTT